MQNAYQATIEDRAPYLYARVEGPRTRANVLRFFEEVREARERLGHSSVLMHMNMSGPSLGIEGIFNVVVEGSRTAAAVRRIAYVEGSVANPVGPGFAATVAANRGVNIRLFESVDAAITWLLHP